MRTIPVCLLLVLSAPAWALQPVRAVPAYVLDTADESVLDFIRVLVTASVPVGAEIHEGDDRVRVVIDSKRRALSTTVPLADAIAAFHAAHRDYSAAFVDDVLLVRPVKDRVPFLDGPSEIGVVTIIGVHMAIRTILSPLNPRLLGPTVGSLGGYEALKGLTKEIELDGSGGRRVIDTLNQVVRQMPGAWVVVTGRRGDEWRITRRGFVYTDFNVSLTAMPQ